MRKKDIKIGELYYHDPRYGTDHPIVFLDTDNLYEQMCYTLVSDGPIFRQAPSGHKRPERGYHKNRGYAAVIVGTDTPENRERARSLTVKDLLTAKSSGSTQNPVRMCSSLWTTC